MSVKWTRRFFRMSPSTSSLVSAASCIKPSLLSISIFRGPTKSKFPPTSRMSCVFPPRMGKFGHSPTTIPTKIWNFLGRGKIQAFCTSCLTNSLNRSRTSGTDTPACSCVQTCIGTWCKKSFAKMKISKCRKWVRSRTTLMISWTRTNILWRTRTSSTTTATSWCSWADG